MKPGDHVQWMISTAKHRRTGMSISFSTKRGVILSISGDLAKIRDSDIRRTHVVQIAHLEAGDQPSALTRALFPDLAKEAQS